jgi:hypothetical protein
MLVFSSPLTVGVCTAIDISFLDSFSIRRAPVASTTFVAATFSGGGIFSDAQCLDEVTWLSVDAESQTKRVYLRAQRAGGPFSLELRSDDLVGSTTQWMTVAPPDAGMGDAGPDAANDAGAMDAGPNTADASIPIGGGRADEPSDAGRTTTASYSVSCTSNSGGPELLALVAIACRFASRQTGRRTFRRAPHDSARRGLQSKLSSAS